MIGFSLDREERGMKRKRHSPEEVINKLREAEILIQKGQEVPRACRCSAPGSLDTSLSYAARPSSCSSRASIGV